MSSLDALEALCSELAYSRPHLRLAIRLLSFVSIRLPLSISVLLLALVLATLAYAQDASTGSLRGVVVDPDSRSIAGASIIVVNDATGLRYPATTDTEGRFALELLQPGDYSARADAPGMAPELSPQMHVDVGGTTELEFRLAMAGAQERIPVQLFGRWRGQQ